VRLGPDRTGINDGPYGCGFTIPSTTLKDAAGNTIGNIPNH
jgi:hypothetical protein